MPIKDPLKKKAYQATYYALNRERLQAQIAAHKKAHPEKVRARTAAYLPRSRVLERERKYGISAAAQEALLAKQKICEICGSPGSKYGLCLDHDHSTGALRGVLCTQCNTAIGMMKDSPVRLRKAAAYLDKRQPALGIAGT